MTDAIQHLITRLKAQSLAGQIDTIANAAIETGGYFDQPRDGDNRSSHLTEIKAHGLCATGNSDADAIRNWIRVAENHTRAENAAATITASQPVDADDLRNACQIVVNHRGHTPHPLHARAELLLGVLDRVGA